MNKPHKIASSLVRCFTILSFVFALASPSQSQILISSVAPRNGSSSVSVPMISEPPSPHVPPAIVLARFIAAERQLRDELNQHTFKRDVVLQTIGADGSVTGEYIRNSQFTFDDHGNRIERILFRPKSTLKHLKITKEDIQDLAGAQLLGIDVMESAKYNLSPAGTEIFNSKELFIIEVTPNEKPDPYRMRNRFFVGRIWIDPLSFQIVKVRGIVEPQGKQRFPVFETWRESIGGSLFFPVRTEADDVLHFPNRDVHYRIKVRYYDYKRFVSTVKITEVGESSAN